MSSCSVEFLKLAAWKAASFLKLPFREKLNWDCQSAYSFPPKCFLLRIAGADGGKLLASHQLIRSPVLVELM